MEFIGLLLMGIGVGNRFEIHPIRTGAKYGTLIWVLFNGIVMTGDPAHRVHRDGRLPQSPGAGHSRTGRLLGRREAL